MARIHWHSINIHIIHVMFKDQHKSSKVNECSHLLLLLVVCFRWNFIGIIGCFLDAKCIYDTAQRDRMRWIKFYGPECHNQPFTQWSCNSDSAELLPLEVCHLSYHHLVTPFGWIRPFATRNKENAIVLIQWLLMWLDGGNYLAVDCEPVNGLWVAQMV